MSNRSIKAILLVCAGAGALLAATAAANAGGFAVREQSAWGQGSSYAGVAAGGDLSAMFWNPATMTQAPGIQSEAVLSGIFPSATNTATAGTLVGIPGFGGTGNTADTALVPSGYLSYQLNPSLWVGLSVNAPFGLSVSFPSAWAGRDYAADDSHLRTYNATPSIAYRINNWISVGAGIQFQYADAALSRGFTAGGLAEVASISGTGWGYGFTAGVTLTPTPATTIGLGYRSAIDQKIDGNFLAGGGAIAIASTASTTINLPDVVSLGLRHRISPQWTLLGTVEWTNWSRIGTSTVSGPPLPPAFLALPFQYQDGWLFSAGAEYQWDRQLTLRAGVGYEKSPITDDVRIPLLPDNDRYWLSVGGTYKLTPKLSFDLAYSHIFVKDTPINISAASGNPWFAASGGVTYIGSVDSHIDIVSVALKYRWDDPAPEPVKQGYFKAK
jgi:long-chain fatty acid transport protein